MIRRAAPFLPLVLLCACFAHGGVQPAEEQEEAARHRGALATLTVDNGTARHLRITVRSVPGPASEISLGEVPAGGAATVAPLPAGEPVVLAAVADDSSRLTLPARSFDIGQRWTWRIPADAVFAPAGGTPP